MSIFNKFLQKAKRFTSPELQAIPAITPANPRKIDEYWLELITQSELIDKAHIGTVLKHYQGRINLSKGIKLTVDEKKILTLILGFLLQKNF